MTPPHSPLQVSLWQRGGGVKLVSLDFQATKLLDSTASALWAQSEVPLGSSHLSLSLNFALVVKLLPHFSAFFASQSTVKRSSDNHLEVFKTP